MHARLLGPILLALTLLPACKSSDPLGTPTDSGSDTGSTGASLSGVTTQTASSTTAGTGGSSSGDASSDAGTTQGVGECAVIECEGEVLACGDCVDNDSDGKVDLADPECVGPCDDLEDTFATGLPGDNMDACNQDCFFDGNSGSGDDKCTWNLKCDPANPGGDDCPYDPDFKNCPETQSEECLMNCAVPSGCDCFGCCTVQVGDISYDIYIGDADCSIATIDQCQSCTKTLDCDDECEPEKCELCFGQDPEDLPPGCDGGECPEGVQTCTIDSMGGSECAAGYYCFLGCCELAPG